MTRTPALSGKQLVKFLKKQGFHVNRISGSHYQLFHSDRKVGVSVPVHGNRSLSPGVLIDILRDAGFTIDDYLRLR